ncbi:MAG: helix-turn-helix domain-containing protein [Haliscomenobacter sp.]|uniref:GlxA family transcriptional regulator n=1 Tax=Haliscomenobacter sp. TaxID=2717303 RepID=UPI0029AD4A01|nr:helix-turn-helix domain-containing protein [Haliscomenobacter sp.]MDX2070860.1 helix-turn-helix domain-containing protein [Haliscomenobacter sp.]
MACIVGAYDIFNKANAVWRQAGKGQRFKIELLGHTEGELAGSPPFSVKPHASIADITNTDLVIIPSSLVRTYENAANSNKMLIKWVAEQYKKGAAVATMCSGAFMLAATGLLNSRACSTHWSLAQEFQALYPKVRLQTDKLITDENGICTNGGAYSFLNLILYLVEKYYDRATAIYCAKIFQIDLDRNQQSGFSIFTGHKKHDDDEVQRAQQIIEQQFQSKMSIKSLAEDLHLSRRNFDRRFIKATGLTPLDYLQRVRIEAAKKSFESSRKTVGEVMFDVGYNDEKAFRDIFSRITGLSPADYKLKYHKDG